MPAPHLDTRLLAGFTFRCRPDCGLCCYAEPRVEPGERGALIALRPELPFRREGGGTFLVARPNGGACPFLQANRCSGHSARPHPCREFPIHVHVGTRLQASLVLGCPGLELTALLRADWTRDGPPSVGLGEELAAVASRITPSILARMQESERRRRAIERSHRRAGSWVGESDIRARLARQSLRPGPADFPAEPPPPAEDGLELLPLYFDGRAGPVALAEGLGGWEAMELSPHGGTSGFDAVVPPPDRPPPLDPEGEAMLDGYLAYLLAQDHLLALVAYERSPDPDQDLAAQVADELRYWGAIALSRASVRAKIRGRGGRALGAAEVADGIRATDAERLDRPTWGDRL